MQTKTILACDRHIIGYCQAGDPKTDLDASMNVSASAFYRLIRHMDCKGHWFGIWDQNKTIGIDKPMYTDQVLHVDPDKSGYLYLSNVRFLRGYHRICAHLTYGFARYSQADCGRIVFGCGICPVIEDH